MATARESTIYNSLFTLKHLGDARRYRGQIFPLRFEATVVSLSATLDTYLLTRIPANHTVIDLFCTTSGLGASAGSGRTVAIGDATDNDRYMVATDFDVLNAFGVLAYAGAGYTPAADTDVIALFTNAPVVGQLIKGHILVIAP